MGWYLGVGPVTEGVRHSPEQRALQREQERRPAAHLVQRRPVGKPAGALSPCGAYDGCELGEERQWQLAHLVQGPWRQ